MHLVSCTNTHHDVTDLVNLEMVKNAKSWTSWERNITFLQNKKILNMCLRWHISSSHNFVVEVTFKWQTQRMEIINWIYRCGTLCWFIWKSIIQIKYSRSSLAPENSRCSHQQPYNLFSVFGDFWTFAEISGKPISVDSKQKN